VFRSSTYRETSVFFVTGTTIVEYGPGFRMNATKQAGLESYRTNLHPLKGIMLVLDT